MKISKQKEYKRYATYFLGVLAILIPSLSFAELTPGQCSTTGYTIATVNGVMTDNTGAEKNMDKLSKIFGPVYNNQVIDYQYLLNPSHFKGTGDALKVVIQKFFQNETIRDYDLAQMFIDASQKVKTQKLLLVAHSQGNFYANSFYDVATKDGGVLPQSLGVYAVASPSNHLAKKNSGLWLTSYTDHVIAGLVGGTVGGIVPPNIYIAEVAGDTDPFSGHDFSEVYLKYASNQVVTGVYESLRRLSNDPFRNPNAPCITPPPSLRYSLLYKAESGAFFVIDSTIKFGPQVATAIKETAVYAVNGAANITVAVANATVAVASTMYNTVAGALSGTAVAGGNSAAVILATQTQTQNSQVSSMVSAINKSQTTVVPTAVVSKPTTQTQPTQPTALTPAPPVALTPVSAPKLIFVGSFGAGFGGGGGAPPQVLGTQTTIETVDEATDTGGSGSGGGTLLSVPELSVPQCAYSLATSTDGCLLATTTVRFEWTPVAGATYYSINKNGAYATTTEIGTDIAAPDFFDYSFAVSAVDAGGYASATSTKTVSVATIPIAINEIAWMGTVASTSAEWVEIKNNTTHTIDLSQWALASSDSKPFIVLTGTIAPREYRVLERWLDATVADVTAGQVYGNGGSSWALGQDGEQLNLSYASTTLDQTPSGAWVAGYNSTTTRKTMERYSSRELGTDASNWGTNLGYIKNGTDALGNAIDGTPGAQNSVSTLINKGQDITSDFTLTTAEERFVVTSDGVWVYASTTLTIEPGVTISFYPNAGDFFIQGAIDAQGTAGNPIIFNSFSGAQEGGFWIDNATATSTFDHVRFENTGSIVVSGSDIEVRNSEFVHADGGVEAYENAIIFIENTHFASSTRDTLGAYEGSTMHLASSTIANQLDGDAIGIYDGSSLTMSSTTIDGVHNGNGIGAYDSVVSIASSTIRNTESTAIASSNSTTTIANTLVQSGALDDGAGGISVDGGTATITDTTVSGFADWTGISVTEPTEPVAITGGEVTGNAIGVEMYPAGSVFIEDVSFVHDNGMDYKVW